MRVKKSAPAGVTLYPFAGYEIDPNGVITKFIRAGGESIASKKGAAKYFYHNDHLGSVNVITDITGMRVQLNEYDPWGAVSRASGTIDPDTRFTGQKLDPETGLYYYGGRYYDAEIGRFISADPFIQTPFDPQNLNRYSYVINNPQNYIDPDGYFHQVKKQKKKGGFFRIFSAIFTIILSIVTLQPELAALAFIAEGINTTNLILGSLLLARGGYDLVSGLNDLQGSSPPTSTVGTSSPTIFNNSGVRRISSGDFPGEMPGWNFNFNFCGFFACEAGAAQPPRNPPPRAVRPPNRNNRGIKGLRHREEYTEPRNIREQMALAEARVISGNEHIMKNKLLDPKYPEPTWGKFQYVRDRGTDRQIVIHYFEHIPSGHREGFKFVVD